MDIPYEPTWFSDDLNVYDHWAVYDQSEGFQPAYALVGASTADDAVGIAEELSQGRINGDNETVMAVKVEVRCVSV